MQMFLPFHWPRVHHVTCKQLPTNNGVLMSKASFGKQLICSPLTNHDILLNLV